MSYKRKKYIFRRIIEKFIMKSYVFVDLDDCNNIYIKFFRSSPHTCISVYFGKTMTSFISKNIDILLDNINEKNIY